MACRVLTKRLRNEEKLAELAELVFKGGCRTKALEELLQECRKLPLEVD